MIYKHSDTGAMISTDSELSGKWVPVKKAVKRTKKEKNAETSDVEAEKAEAEEAEKAEAEEAEKAEAEEAEKAEAEAKEEKKTKTTKRSKK